MSPDVSRVRIVTLPLLFALSASGAYVIGARIWGASDAARGDGPMTASGCNEIQASSTARGRPSRDLNQVARAVSAVAAGPRPARIELPPLDDLGRAALDDPRALHLRTALMMQVGQQVFTQGSCTPAALEGETVVALTLTITVRDERSAVFQDPRDPIVVEGAPLSASAQSCLVNQLRGPTQLLASGHKPFPAGFHGDARVAVIIAPPAAPAAEVDPDTAN